MKKESNNSTAFWIVSVVCFLFAAIVFFSDVYDDINRLIALVFLVGGVIIGDIAEKKDKNVEAVENKQFVDNYYHEDVIIGSTSGTSEEYVPFPEKPCISKKFLLYVLIATVLASIFCITRLDPAAFFESLVIILIIPVLFPLYIVLLKYLLKRRLYKLACTNFEKYKKWYLSKKHTEQENQNREDYQLERERIDAIKSQQKTEEWAVRYSTSPCPYCGHYKVRSAKWEDKSLSVAFWGIASSKIGTNYKCEQCKRMWE